VLTNFVWSTCRLWVE